MTFCCSVAIVLTATSIRASDEGKRVADLTQVHRIAVLYAPPDREEEIKKALLQIPDVQLASEEEADLLITYEEEEGTTPGETDWTVAFQRLDCQNPEFGKPPAKPSDGPCERRIFLRTDLGSMAGTASVREGAVNAFVARLRQAIVAPRVP